MTDKHTPGPWIASKFGCQVLTGDSWSTVCTLKDGAEWEDGRGKYAQEYDWQNQEANARLIAAAPSLLDACLAAREWLSGWASAEPYLSRIDAALTAAGAPQS